jgi:hypothetical protein
LEEKDTLEKEDTNSIRAPSVSGSNLFKVADFPEALYFSEVDDLKVEQDVGSDVPVMRRSSKKDKKKRLKYIVEELSPAEAPAVEDPTH